MTALEDKLKRGQRRALNVLLAGGSLDVAAAAAAGVTTRTLRRWRHEHNFSRAFREAQDEAFGEARAQLRLASADAALALRAIAADDSAPEGARINAARILLDLAVRDYELSEIENRIKDFERRLGGGRQWKGTP